jgi:HEAT repeat protein
MATGGALGGNAVEGLLFVRFGTRYLPQLYIGLGILNLLFVLAGSAMVARGNRGRLYIRLLLAMALVLIAARVLLGASFIWFYPVLWLLMCAMGNMQGLIAWGFAGLVCDMRQAKRLFPLFATGNVLASVVGGLATAPLAAFLHSENLLIVWALLLMISFVLGIRLMRRVAAEPPPDPDASFARDMRQGFDAVIRSRMLTWLAFGAVLFSLLYFTLSFPFARAAALQYPDADRLTAFLGIFQAISTSTACVIGLVLANRFYARFGLMTGVLVFPFIYVVGFAALAVRPDFPILVGFRFLQMTWLWGIAGTAFHATFNVIPGERRDQARSFVDGIGTQAGTILAGLVLIAGQQALSNRELYVLGAVLGALTVAVSWLARRQYRPALLDALRTGQPDVFVAEEKPFGGFAQDAAAMEVATAGLRDPDPRVRRVAAVVISQSDDETARSQLFALRTDSDPEIRVAVLNSLGPDWQQARASLDDADLHVRCSAAAILLRNGEVEPARSVLQTAFRSNDDEVRTLAISCLGPESVEQLQSALDDAAPRVRRAAARGLAKFASERACDEILAGRHEQLLLEELDELPADRRSAMRAYAEEKAGAARRLLRLAQSSAVAGKNEAVQLLTDSLRRKAESSAFLAFSAVRLLSNRARIQAAIAGLRSKDGDQKANALELLEAAEPAIVRPLLPIWEPAPAGRPAAGWLDEVLADKDEWLRACAEFVAATSSGSVKTLPTLSLMEKVVFMRKVALFEDLAPADLKQIAGLATERFYPSGARLVRQGDPGDELYIIINGKVQVVMDGNAVATRSTGDSVGEMAILTLEPRSATLIADGDVRVLCVEQRQFEVMLRDRPEIGLAVIKTLAHRLRERPTTNV